MEGIKVSVIVPVYNTEKYLPKCAESLMAQTLKEMEIIFVDDGSTDSSPKMCDGYASQDSRIRVIHKPKNEGLGAARQTGLEAAKGKYVISADSDDWVEPDMYERLYKKAESTQADMTICRYLREYKDRTEQSSDRVATTKKECIIDFLHFAITNNLWTKLLVKDLILKHGLSFNAGVSMGEDRVTFFKYLYYAADVIAEEPGYLYHYNQQNENALTRQMTKKSIDEDKKTIDILRSILQGSEYMGYLQQYIARHNISLISFLIEKNDIAMAEYVVGSAPFSAVFPYLTRWDHRITSLFIYARMYRFVNLILRFRRFLISKM